MTTTLDRPAVLPEHEAAPARVSFGRRFQVFLLAMLAVELVVVGLLYVPMPPNPDQELYDYMAWLAIDQGGFYRNGGDMNMPGEALIHLASMKLFGDRYWSYRLLDYLVFVGSMGGVAVLSRKYYGKIFAGLFIALYPVIYTTSGPWMTGQRDVISTHCVLLAGFAYLRRVEGGGVGWVLLAGLSIAWAILIKPTFLAFAPLLLIFVYVMLRPPPKLLAKDTLTIAAVGLAILGGLLAVGQATGSLAAWWDMTITYTLQQYAGGHSYSSIAYGIAQVVMKSWHWFTIMALIGMILLVPRRPRAPLSVLLAVMSTVVISTVVQRKGFGYHYGGLLSIIAFLGAFYFTELFRLAMRVREPWLAFQILAFPVLISLGGLVSKCSKEFGPQAAWYLGGASYAEMLHAYRFDDVVEAADYLRSNSRPGEKVWTNSSHLMINSLAGRSYGSRFITFSMVRFNNATDLGWRWRGEIEGVFKDHPPEIIILEFENTHHPETLFNMQDIRPYEPISAMTQALESGYTMDRRVGRFVFYRRDPSRPIVITSGPVPETSIPAGR